MSSSKFVFCLTCLFMWNIAQTAALKLSSSVRQESVFISVEAGDKLTLRCFYEVKVSAWFYWYKQTLGQRPRRISTFYAYDKKATFHEELKDNPRFALDIKNGANHLTISDLRISDSATYYCVRGYSVMLTFLESIIVSVKGSGLNIQAAVHQSVSETIQPGGSVTLSCTVHTGTCDGGHSVYWFKDSEESHPGLIYTNDQCERKPETQTHTCVYNLPMQNLNLSHAGTYYCAVASCGHILFGNGTKLHFEDVDTPVLVYFLSGAVTFNIILILLLAFSLYKMKKRISYQSPESQARFIAPSTANIESIQDADNLHYAALNVNPAKRASRQRDITKNDCVYSGVRQ